MKNMNNNDQYLFDDLIDDWQQYSSRIDQIVSNHPITVNQINHRAWRPSWHRRLLLSSSLRALVCLIAMVFLSFLFGSYVADIFDLIPLLLIGGMLLFVFVSSLRLAPPHRHHPCDGDVSFCGERTALSHAACPLHPPQEEMDHLALHPPVLKGCCSRFCGSHLLDCLHPHLRWPSDVCRQPVSPHHDHCQDQPSG